MDPIVDIFSITSSWYSKTQRFHLGKPWKSLGGTSNRSIEILDESCHVDGLIPHRSAMIAAEKSVTRSTFYSNNKFDS